MIGLSYYVKTDSYVSQIYNVWPNSYIAGISMKLCDWLLSHMVMSMHEKQQHAWMHGAWSMQFCIYNHFLFTRLAQSPVQWNGLMDHLNGLLEWTTGMDHWNGLLEWTTGMDHWNGLLEWTTGMDHWNGLLEWTTGMDHWNGPLEWTTGMDHWNGLLEWTTGMDYWNGPLEWTNGMHSMPFQTGEYKRWNGLEWNGLLEWPKRKSNSLGELA